MTAFTSELIGTFVLMLLGNGVVANVVLPETKGNNSGWIVITTGWALAVYIAVLIAGPYSGAHINPAVTIGLAIGGKFEWAMAGTYISAQLLGAFLGGAVVWLMHKDHYLKTNDPASIQATFCTAPAIKNKPSNLLSEIIGTFVLLAAVLFMTPPEIVLQEGQTTTFGLGSLGALPVALVVWGVGLCLGGTTGYAINPARDLGPRIAHAILPIKGKGSSGWDYAWVPVFGPLLGGALAALLYINLG